MLHLLWLSLAGLLASGPAASDNKLATGDPTRGLTIAWEAPSFCGSEEQLRGRLRMLLSAPEASLVGELRVHIGPAASEFGSPRQMTLKLVSAAGPWEQELEVENCLQALEVATLITAITLDPVAASKGLERVKSTREPDPPARGNASGAIPEPPPKNPGKNPPARAPEATSLGSTAIATDPPEPVNSPARGRRLGISLRAAVNGSYGPLPNFGVLLLGGLGVTINRRALVEVSLLHRVPSMTSVASAPGVSLDSRLTGGRLGACWIFARQALELPLCTGLDLAGLRVEALGLSMSNPATGLYVGWSGEARLLWRPWRAFGFGLNLGAAATLRGHQYRLGAPSQLVLSTTPASGYAGLSIEVRLP